jgi:hypothetical protein
MDCFVATLLAMTDADRRSNIRLWLWVSAFAETTIIVWLIARHFVSGQPLSLAVKNALSPGMTASCL